MTPKEKNIIKTLNKKGVDTRFISLYEDKIFINNLKFSKFSRKKEEKFNQDYPHIQVIRSTLFQKMCIKVSRTVKNQIKPHDILYIEDDNSLESILLYILLEAYKRKYGIKITNVQSENTIKISNYCLDDFTLEYLDLMINGEEILETVDSNTVCPLAHVPHQWIVDWAKSTDIKYSNINKYEESIPQEIIDFLDKHIPNVKESIKQSVNYLQNSKEVK